MAARLLDRLGRPTTFVVGKGGVGKTTTAGALALGLADRGTAVHLLSTDPAHSVGDLFAQPLGGGPTPSACTERLLLEELDGAARARARLTDLEPALRQIIESGTYLDADDADTLLGGALPGLDEIGGALRIAELAATGARLVVDTAPTGHTLRLLDGEAVARGWIQVFEAMAAKADVVASALVGRSVHLEAEDALDQLANDMAAFSEAARHADFLVVTGAGAAVRAETERLVEALEGRGLSVAATVAVDRPGARADFLLPARPGVVGCQGLREWWSGWERPVDTAPGPVTRRSARPTPEPEIGPSPGPLDRELVIFTGKGGVGKTTCAAAHAVRLAAREPVALMGADPAGSLVDVVAGPVPGLTVLESDAEAELDRLKERYREDVHQLFAAAGLELAARMDREIIESLWGAAPPGIDELMALARLADDAPSGARLVLDTAPTGHFLRLMAMPELALDWTHRLMRILLKYRAVAGLDAAAGPLLRLARRLRALRERLVDPTRTSVVVVTVDEPLVLAETHRLLDRIRQLGLPVGAVLLNRADPDTRDVPGFGPMVPVFRAPAVDEPTGADGLRAFAAAWERVS
jgi:arsenite/tail-anchored protein-transporting ATPase